VHLGTRCTHRNQAAQYSKQARHIEPEEGVGMWVVWKEKASCMKPGEKSLGEQEPKHPAPSKDGCSARRSVASQDGRSAQDGQCNIEHAQQVRTTRIHAVAVVLVSALEGVSEMLHMQRDPCMRRMRGTECWCRYQQGCAQTQQRHTCTAAGQR